MHLADAVVETYDAARARGESRASAFAEAVEAYAARHPHLRGNESVVAVARLLLQAAAATGIAEGRFASAAEATLQPVISW
jgi:hypothetical protein